MGQQPGVELERPDPADGLGYPSRTRLLDLAADNPGSDLSLQRQSRGFTARPFCNRTQTSVLQPRRTGSEKTNPPAVDLDDVGLDDGCQTFECFECTQR